MAILLHILIYKMKLTPYRHKQPNVSKMKLT